MPDVLKFTDKQLIKAIEGSRGIMSAIAKKLRCDWHTAKKYIDASEKAKMALSAESEVVLDIAEETIFDDIKDKKDVGTAKWLLSKKGKERGYGEDINLNIGVVSEEGQNKLNSIMQAARKKVED